MVKFRCRNRVVVEDRARLEMVEATKNTATKQMEKMTIDNCQETLNEKSGN